MQKKLLLCMTSKFDFDQRMQRHAYSLHKYFSVHIYNRSSTVFGNYTIINANCTFNKGPFFYLEFNIRLLFHILRNQYDVIYLVDTDTLLAGGITSCFSKKAYVFDSHEWYTEVPELQDSYVKKTIWQWIEKIFVKKMQLCITVNDSLAQLFSNQFLKTFIAIKNVPFKRNKGFAKDISKKIIIYQGALNKGRGLEVAIDAMKYLKGFEFHIYGQGDIMGQLINETKEKGLEDKIKFMGVQSPEILWEKSNEAYIGLNLLEDTSLNYYYSLANKFFDYMHAEIPSVNMDFPEYQMILMHYEVGVTIPSLDTEVLVHKILALDDPIFRKRLIDNCVRYKDIFCWEKEQDKLIEAINGLNYN